MIYPDTFELSLPSDREIRVTRDFQAPRSLLFDAFTKPELVRRWLLGPDGWTMPVCEIDLRVGGAYRYVWHNDAKAMQMGVEGVFREIAAPERLVASERFAEAWYPGEALNTSVFVQKGALTNATITMLYVSKEARDTAKRSGMEQGLAAGYNRLEQLLPGLLLGGTA